MSRTLRDAEVADRDDVAAFTGDTWPDQPIEDYLPGVFESWAESDDPDERTLVADVDGTVAGVCHATTVGTEEGWIEGIRVHPDYRGAGHGRALTEALLSWCGERGATVARNLVYDWNEAGLGQSRATGFEPVTTCRWAHPDPAAETVDDAVVDDPAAAWRYWTDSDARTHLRGLAVDPEQSWAFSELTRERLDAVAADERVFAVVDDGVGGMAMRTRSVEREIGADDQGGDGTEGEDGDGTDDGGDDGTEGASSETVVEYGAAAWRDPAAGEQVLDAIRADAAVRDADAIRVCLPDTARYLSDAAATGSALSDDALVVHAADVTGRR